MNGKIAKRLRRMARQLERPQEAHYAPLGELRRRGAARIVKDHNGVEHTIPAPLVRRPIALGDCERRVIQEAKRIYVKG